MNATVIPIHSVVDVITNSSTVVYTHATQATIRACKTIINGLLSLGDAPFDADDLFTFELVEEYDDTNLVVQTRDPDNEVASEVAEALQQLVGTYSIEAYRDG